jgi:hypothetical protein
MFPQLFNCRFLQTMELTCSAPFSSCTREHSPYIINCCRYGRVQNCLCFLQRCKHRLFYLKIERYVSSLPSLTVLPRGPWSRLQPSSRIGPLEEETLVSEEHQRCSVEFFSQYGWQRNFIRQLLIARINFYHRSELCIITVAPLLWIIIWT